MRHIDNQHLPRAANLAALNGLNTQIAGTSVVDKQAFIRANKASCSALKPELWRLGGYKCWYSEAILGANQGEVEHYRPKLQVSFEKHKGYWWRAFDWTNLRLAHPTVNKRTTDPITGKLVGKGAHFPLRAGDVRALCLADEVNEHPVLLDPTVFKDTLLIAFDSSSGRPIPTADKTKDPWGFQRAEDSIDFYYLAEGTWNFQRKELMQEVYYICTKLIKLRRKLPAKQTEYDDFLKRLGRMIAPTSEFSSACLQIVKERGLLKHIQNG